MVTHRGQSATAAVELPAPATKGSATELPQALWVTAGLLATDGLVLQASLIIFINRIELACLMIFNAVAAEESSEISIQLHCLPLMALTSRQTALQSSNNYVVKIVMGSNESSRAFRTSAGASRQEPQVTATLLAIDVLVLQKRTWMCMQLANLSVAETPEHCPAVLFLCLRKQPALLLMTCNASK